MTKFKALHYVAKFRRELREGIPENAILQSINQMHRVELITFKEASIITDCFWIAKAQVRGDS
tara:strand:+ start:418 stop:606 length:189 start_codon:yes stop_codon:yes gene_type:complete